MVWQSDIYFIKMGTLSNFFGMMPQEAIAFIFKEILFFRFTD